MLSQAVKSSKEMDLEDKFYPVNIEEIQISLPPLWIFLVFMSFT